MPGEKTVEDYHPNPLRHMQYRADCADFYYEPEAASRVDFRGPNTVIHAVEETAERAGRTFNAQMIYAIKLCRGEVSPLPDDERTEEEWRSLLGELEFCFDDEGETWYPGASILGNPHNARCAS